MRGVYVIFTVVTLLVCAELTREIEIPGNDVLLVAAGNESGPNGSTCGKVRYKPRYSGNTTAVDLPTGLRVSPYCGLHRPSRCTLVVNSTQHDAYVSSHVVFLPLQNGFYVLEITHNGSALNGPNYTSFERFPMVQGSIHCPVNCISVGIYRIRARSFYAVCATRSSMLCTCQLSRSRVNPREYSLTNCHTYYYFGVASVLDQLSNIVSSSNPRQPYLYFFVGGELNYVNPGDGTHSSIYVVRECSLVEQLTFRENQLLFIYCDNNVSAVYDLNIGGLLVPYSNGQVFHYQCSTTTNITVRLGTDSGTSNLTYASEDSALNVPLPREVMFEYGTCFILQRHSIFLYLDRRDGVHLFNGTTREFTHLNHTQSCEDMGDGCQWPQVFYNRYVVANNSIRDSLAVYDIERNLRSPILNLDNVPYQAVALIDELQISRPIQTSFTTSTSQMPTPSPVVTSVTPTRTSRIRLTSTQIVPSSTPVTSPSPDVPSFGREFELTGTLIFVVVVIPFVIIITVLLVLITVALAIKLKRHCDSNSESEDHFMGTLTHAFQAKLVVPKQDQTAGPDNSSQQYFGPPSVTHLLHQDSTGSRSVTCTPYTCSEEGTDQNTGTSVL